MNIATFVIACVCINLGVDIGAYGDTSRIYHAPASDLRSTLTPTPALTTNLTTATTHEFTLAPTPAPTPANTSFTAPTPALFTAPKLTTAPNAYDTHLSKVDVQPLAPTTTTTMTPTLTTTTITTTTTTSSTMSTETIPAPTTNSSFVYEVFMAMIVFLAISNGSGLVNAFG